MLERTGKSASDYSRNIALLNCRNMASELLLTHVHSLLIFMSENDLSNITTVLIMESVC